MWGLGSKLEGDMGGRGQVGVFPVRQILPKAESHSEEWWLHAESICRDKGLGLGWVAREIGQGGS